MNLINLTAKPLNVQMFNVSVLFGWTVFTNHVLTRYISKKVHFDTFLWLFQSLRYNLLITLCDAKLSDYLLLKRVGAKYCWYLVQPHLGVWCQNVYSMIKKKKRLFQYQFELNWRIYWLIYAWNTGCKCYRSGACPPSTQRVKIVKVDLHRLSEIFGTSWYLTQMPNIPNFLGEWWAIDTKMTL